MLLMIARQVEEFGEARVSSLGKALKLSRPAVSRMLHTLKKKGYVQMKNNEKDQRFVYVYFTDRGRDVLKKEMSFACELMQKIRRRMGDECMKEYLYCAEKFHEILSEEVQNLGYSNRNEGSKR
ncbi:MAG: MarR family transcriptional regulator [Clostridiales bacterium]|nr:MarR family transcriptional regulator [Clostridiales bacterium]